MSRAGRGTRVRWYRGCVDDELTHDCACGVCLDPNQLVGLELKDRGRTIGRILSAQVTPQGMRCRVAVRDPADVTAVERIAAKLDRVTAR